MSTHGNHFAKRERLVSRTLIEALFCGGRSMSAFPLRMVYLAQDAQEGDEPVQLLLSVPKRRLRHAVDRNRVKRQLREAYRRHKETLYSALPQGRRLVLALVWQSGQRHSSADIEQRVAVLIQRLAEKL